MNPYHIMYVCVCIRKHMYHNPTRLQCTKDVHSVCCCTSLAYMHQQCVLTCTAQQYSMHTVVIHCVCVCVCVCVCMCVCVCVCVHLQLYMLGIYCN